ncbi:MAG: hypothetical protein ACRD1Y_08295 [Terriglobales bacterium]
MLSRCLGLVLTAGLLVAAVGAQARPAAATPETQSLQAIDKLVADPNTQPAALDAAVDQFRQQYPHSPNTLHVLVLTVRFHRERQEFLPELRYGEAALAIAPGNLYTLSSLGQAIAQNVSSSDLDFDQLLQQAEGYDRDVLAATQKFHITAQGMAFAGAHYTPAQARLLDDFLSAPAYISLAQIARLRGDYSGAVAAYRRALPHLTHANVQAQTYYEIGTAEASAHQDAAAKADLDKAGALAPDSQLMQRMVKDAETKLGN